MKKGQGHSCLQLTFTFLQVALSFQVLDGTYSNATSFKRSLMVLLEAMPAALCSSLCARLKALYKRVLPPQSDRELFAGWGHVLFIFASPTVSNIVPGSQRAPSTICGIQG